MKHTYSINLYLFEMKRIILCLCLMLSLSGFAQNRWKIYAGGSISHDCGGYFEWNADGNTGFDWGGGAFLGGGYEINFNKNWSFTPALEFSYTDNGAYYNKTGVPAYHPYGYGVPDIWTGSWAVNIPLEAGFRFPVSDYVNLKINAGVYLSEAFHVSHYERVGGTSENPVIEKKKASSDFGQDFQLGFSGGISVETGRHFSYFLRTQYPFLKDRWSTSTLTLGLGVAYSF